MVEGGKTYKAPWEKLSGSVLAAWICSQHKKLLVGFLLGLAFVELAQSMQCYVCKVPADISQCRTPVTCLKATVCTTTLHSVDLGELSLFGNITVTRDCEEECLSGIGAQKPKSCCYTDLCTDDKSSSGVRSSSAALALVALAGTVLQSSL
ncbi:LOW QUALITY PROTEIN: ly6/PLAUR domain-containing protein 2-like [Geothlypis trichas]